MSVTVRKYQGADWLKLNGKQLSPLGENVADLLGDVFLGIYHIDDAVMRADWSNTHHVLIRLRQGLATHDFNQLTTLVVLAHDRCIRVEISGSGPKLLQLLFHQRQREGDYSKRHPTIETHIEQIRGVYGGPTE